MAIKDPYSEDSSSNNYFIWWKKATQGLHYAEYPVNHKTKVLVGVRPDAYGTTYDFYKSIDAWINVSDRFVRHEKGTQNMFAPWNEGGQPQIETIFSVLKTLDHLINEQNAEKIYISCDGGTHRAVSMFGFYLLAYETQRSKQINNNYRLINRENWSNPLEYAESYLHENKIPALPIILEKIKEHTVGFPTHGVSLEQFLKDHIPENFLKEYYFEKFMKRDLKESFWQLKFSLINLFKYTLWGTPKAKISIYLHKKLNTKKGQWYKKHNF